MKIKLSDYIADFFAARGLSDVFTVTGGGAMHLNDSFGHERGFTALTTTTSRRAPSRRRHTRG